jgi:hypothetical protein
MSGTPIIRKRRIPIIIRPFPLFFPVLSPIAPLYPDFLKKQQDFAAALFPEASGLR